MAAKGNKYTDLKASAANLIAQAWADLDDLRCQIQAARAEIKSLETMPLPLSEAQPRLADLVKLAGDLWTNSRGYSLSRRALEVRGLAETVTLGVFPSSSRESQPEMFKFLCWLLPDQVQQALATSLKAEYTAMPEPPLSTEARDKALTDARKHLMDLEVAEETLIRDAESGGLPMARRSDANPAVVLAC